MPSLEQPRWVQQSPILQVYHQGYTLFVRHRKGSKPETSSLPLPPLLSVCTPWDSPE